MDNKTSAAARVEAMNWATRTSRLGEDALAVLARAQLYEEYIQSGATPPTLAHSFGEAQSK
jgi:hypothetical protein